MRREALVRARWRLPNVNPRATRKESSPRSNLRVLSNGCEPRDRTRGDGDRPRGTHEASGAAVVEAGARMKRKSRPGGPGLVWLFNLAGVGNFEPRERWNRRADRSSTTGRKGRRRIAQPRKARKRLPVRPVGDGTEPRTVRVEGYAGASCFVPQKSPVSEPA